jgi:hypothetical protein
MKDYMQEERLRRETTLIDRESAEKALAALDQITGDDLRAALAKSLSRKLGNAVSPLADSDNLPDKFERFFDTIFNVAFADKPLATERVIELVEGVIADLVKAAAEDRELADLFNEDAEDYERMLALLKVGGRNRDCRRKIREHGHCGAASALRTHSSGEIRAYRFSSSERLLVHE